LFSGVERLDFVLLNAGISYSMKLMVETPLDEIKRVMDVNVWANKIILDWLHNSGIAIEQIVLISSGAGVVGTRGWSSYGLSKCTLNMMTKLYCREFENSHMAAIAPGVTMTEMLERHLGRIDLEQYPHLQQFVDAHEAGTIQTSAEAASRLCNVLDLLKQEPTGQYFGPSLMKEHG
jgi:benzil reductase ((S)-benzoin forming)